MADIVKLTIKDETQYPLSIPEAIVDPNDNKPLSDTLPFIKDKKYNGKEYSGMGRRYLKKNMIAGINVLEQSMIDSPNTIYIIQYDYDLQGETITIPEGCILKFQGGSFSNGTIIGNNTIVNSINYPIFYNELIINGSWLCPQIYSDWFNNIEEIDCVKQLIKLSSDDIFNDIYVRSGLNCIISATEEGVRRVGELKIKSNTHLHLDGNILLASNNYFGYSLILISNKENVTISGAGCIIGDKNSHIDNIDRPTSEWGFGINIERSTNVKIDGIEIYNCTGDGIFIDNDIDLYKSNIDNFINIKNVTIHDCRRQGISIQHASKVYIDNFKIYNIKGTNPQYGIDIEPWANDCEDIRITNGEIYDCRGGIQFTKYTLDVTNNRIKNVVIDNINFYTKNKEEYPMYNVFSMKDCEDVTFKNIKNDGQHTGVLCYFSNCENVVFNNCNLKNSSSYAFGSSLDNPSKNILFVNSVLLSCVNYASNVKFINCILKSSYLSKGPGNQLCSNVIVDNCLIKNSICRGRVDNFTLKNSILYNYDGLYYCFESQSESGKINIINNVIFCNTHNFNINATRLIFKNNICYSDFKGAYIIYLSASKSNISDNLFYASYFTTKNENAEDSISETFLYANNKKDISFEDVVLSDEYPMPNDLL